MTEQEKYTRLRNVQATCPFCFWTEDMRDILRRERKNGNVMLLCDDGLWTCISNSHEFLKGRVYALVSGCTPSEEFHRFKVYVLNDMYYVDNLNWSRRCIADMKAFVNFVEWHDRDGTILKDIDAVRSAFENGREPEALFRKLE